MRAVDQHSGEKMMRGIAMELDAGLPTDLRTAAFGADDEAAGCLVRLTLVTIGDGWACREIDTHIGDTAAHGNACVSRLFDQELTQGRVADAERDRHVRDEDGEIEAGEFAHLSRQLLVV